MIVSKISSIMPMKKMDRFSTQQIGMLEERIDNPIKYISAPIDYSNVSFGALVVKNAAMAESTFFNKFKASKLPLVKYLKETAMSPAAVFKVLCKATSDEDTSSKVAKELSSNPRKGNVIRDFLIEKLGGNKTGETLFMTWFHDEQYGYRRAYEDYYNAEIWDKAENMTEIIKHSPIVAPWALRSKADFMNIEPTLGQVPSEFGNVKEFRNLVKYLKKWNEDLQKNLQADKEKIKAASTGDSMETATKINELVASATAPFSLTIGKQDYIITPVVKSFSAKLIFLIEAISKDVTKPNTNFVLKFAPHSIKPGNNKDRAKKFAENQAIRPDMPYLDSLVDFYLKENKSPNAPEVEFFDYKTQAVLYKRTKGVEPKIPDRYADNLYVFRKFPKISDIFKLGVELSDVHEGNFLVDEAGNYRLIDSGHVKYSSPFRPPVIGKHIVYGNLCGRELCK